MELRVLGAVEAHANGRAVDLGPSYQRCVLAALVVDANHVLPVDTLLGRVWADAHAHRATFYSYISRLRKVLGVDGEVEIVRRSGGYQVTVDPLAVDLHRFRHLVDLANGSDDPEQALARYELGLGLWRGDAFEGLDTQWLNQLRDSLNAERRAAEFARNELMLRLGRHADLLTELAASVAAHPLDERLALQLMLALYRSGRRTEALVVYRDTRTALVGDLGLEPGPELRELHRQILAEAVDAGAGRPQAVPAVRPRQLPADVVHFTGRARYLAELRGILERSVQAGPAVSTVIAIDGMAGVGKTTLAVHFGHSVAGRFPDGQLYVDLRGHAVTSPMTTVEALSRLVRSLNLPVDRMPHDEEELAATYRSLLAGRRMLVVLDNAQRDDQVRALLPGTPGCLVVVTSRAFLAGLDNVDHVRLDVFDEAEALALMSRLAGRDRVERDRSAASAVVRMCARLPLAVRIAGARLAARPNWRMATLASRLGDQRQRLDELRAGELAVRTGFAVSHRALETGDDPVDRAAARMFRLLGLLDWTELTLPVAAALFDGNETEALTALERLVDDHLLDSAAPGRYHAHELVRLYMCDVAPEDDRTRALSRVLRCYLDAAEQGNMLVNPSTRHLSGEASAPPRSRFVLKTYADAMAWADAEHANLVAVSRQALGAPGAPAGMAVRLTALLNRVFDLLGHWLDFVVVRELAAEAAERSGDRGGAAFALQDVAWTYVRLGRSEQAIGTARRALEIWRQEGDVRNQQACLNILGFGLRQVARLREALDCLVEAREICERIDYLNGQATTLNHLGLVHQHLADFDNAVRCHGRALEINEDIGDRCGQATALANLGWARTRSGDPATAINLFQTGMAITVQTGDRYQEAELLWGLGQSHHALGRPEWARAFWHRSVALLQRIGALSDDQAATLTSQQVPATPEVIMRNI